MQHGKLRAHRCSGLVNWVFPPLVRKVRPEHLCRRTQCAIILRPKPAKTRSRRKRREDLEQDPNKKNIKNREDGEAQGKLLHDLPEWLEEFAGSSVDGEVSTVRDAHASSSHEPPHPKPPPKVVSGKAHHFYVLPERPKLRSVCKRTKIMRATCRKRTGNQVPRAEKW